MVGGWMGQRNVSDGIKIRRIRRIRGVKKKKIVPSSKWRNDDIQSVLFHRKTNKPIIFKKSTKWRTRSNATGRGYRTCNIWSGYEEMAWAWSMKHEAWGERRRSRLRCNGDERGWKLKTSKKKTWVTKHGWYRLNGLLVVEGVPEKLRVRESSRHRWFIPWKACDAGIVGH